MHGFAGCGKWTLWIVMGTKYDYLTTKLSIKCTWLVLRADKLNNDVINKSMPYNIGNILTLVFIKAITVNKQHLKAN